VISPWTKEVNTMRLIIAIIIILALASYSIACYVDSDCGPGGKCVKSNNSIYGGCINPYNNTIKKGNNEYYKDSGTREQGSQAGKKCYSNVECSPLGQCIKIDNSMYGTCTN
jgi:hypothetical protein